MSGTEADALCLDCGLCCDGTFYGSVVVAQDEKARLGRVGLAVIQHDGALAMPQPCSALRGCLCNVYADRPGACAAYECLLRKRVDAGERTPGHARTAIASMRELLVTIRAGFEVPDGVSIWESILALEEPTTAEGAAEAARRYGPAIDAVGALLALGREEFEPRFAGGGSR